MIAWATGAKRSCGWARSERRCEAAPWLSCPADDVGTFARPWRVLPRPAAAPPAGHQRCCGSCCCADSGDPIHGLRRGACAHGAETGRARHCRCARAARHGRGRATSLGRQRAGQPVPTKTPACRSGWARPSPSPASVARMIELLLGAPAPERQAAGPSAGRACSRSAPAAATSAAVLSHVASGGLQHRSGCAACTSGRATNLRHFRLATVHLDARRRHGRLRKGRTLCGHHRRGPAARRCPDALDRAAGGGGSIVRADAIREGRPGLVVIDKTARGRRAPHS